MEDHQLRNTHWDSFTNSEGKSDRQIETDPKAGSMWARFYDLETGLPFVSDRDGIKKGTLEEIGYERRNGSWYTSLPQKILDDYLIWNQKWEE